MSGFSSLFEPEELFGGYWHRLVGDVGREIHYHEHGVSLDEMRRRLEVLFHGLGGKAGVEIKQISPQAVDYRKNFLAVIGHGSTARTCARFDGDYLFLPQTIDLLEKRSDNEKIYKWLTAWAAVTGDQRPEVWQDPLQADIAFLRFTRASVEKVFARLAGLKPLYQHLVPLLLANRQKRQLPEQEQAVENAIVAMLTLTVPADETCPVWQAIIDPQAEMGGVRARHGYKTFMPFVLWGQVSRNTPENRADKTPCEDAGQTQRPGDEDRRSRRAKRRKSDQVDNKNSLILHRFESVLSWAEMMNIPRAVEDDDEDNAKKASGEDEQLGLADSKRKVATKLKFDLDLAPRDVEHERLAAKFVYPEWDYRKNIYLRDHCRVLDGDMHELDDASDWRPDEAARRRIRAVKRQFEALRPRREILNRQPDGPDLDMDALVRARCDFVARGESSSRVFCDSRHNSRDLSVSVLVDVSRSSESWIEGRQVIDISKEALFALSVGLQASGDDYAINSFSSLRRDRVIFSGLKTFDEALSRQVLARIGALRPGFYTRLGAAIRHAGMQVAKTATRKRLLLILTDGKPNDLDHYEGRYGVEDTAMAVRELRRSGTAVFGITIDKKAQSYFPYIFGRNAYCIIKHASGLTDALPLIYRHLVT